MSGEDGPVIVNGAPVEGAHPPLRQEIRELEKDKDLFNLYLLGLERFQSKDWTKAVSYFQIAGIHGLPYTKWPDKPWNDAMDKLKVDNEQGFCTHSSILFLPWHRPYLALFESELYGHINDIAAEYTEAEGKSRYQAAAKRFRIPYWDWARQNLKPFPDAALEETVHHVVRPGKGGELEPLEHNPLASYKFPKEAEGFRIDPYEGTVRYPLEEGDESKSKAIRDSILAYIRSRDPGPDSNIEKGLNLTERVVYILQSYTEFKPMSNNMYYPEKTYPFNNYGSLEDCHNMMHVFTGGWSIDGNDSAQGHMSQIQLSAFDPIFWLHHANIDRLFNIWQALLEDSSKTETWVESTVSGSFGTWAQLPQTDAEEKDPKYWEDENSPLYPFNKTKDSYWTSKDVKKTDTFGYAYPETQSWLYPNTEEYQKAIKTAIKTLYPKGSLATASESVKASEKTFAARAKTLVEVGKAPIDTPSFVEAVNSQTSDIIKPEEVELDSNRSINSLINDQQYLEWFVNIKAEKHSLGGSYLVHVFLGNVDDTHPYLYPASPNYVGSFAPLGQARGTACEKCKRDQATEADVTSQIPLTIALVERYMAGQLDGLDVRPVEDFLKVNLHWRVVDGRGRRIAADQIKDLLVSVVSNKVTLTDDPSEFPRYAPEMVPHPVITTRADDRTGRGDGTGLTVDQV